MSTTFNDQVSRRRGVTLIELLLVLAVIVVVVGLAGPMFFESLRSQQLRSAADQLRTDMSKARNRAMSSGQMLGLTMTEKSYTIGLASEVDENEASAPAFQQATIELPEGLRLVAPSGQAAGATTPDQSTGATLGSDGIVAYFYPDGTTSTVELQLFNDKEKSLVISLRGITGVALVQEAPSQTAGVLQAEFPAAKGGTTP
jgi:prepilin-type N-terminal cleavage/methylation domain-containing protein